jgi:hypothetical protein
MICHYILPEKLRVGQVFGGYWYAFIMKGMNIKIWLDVHFSEKYDEKKLIGDTNDS